MLSNEKNMKGVTYAHMYSFKKKKKKFPHVYSVKPIRHNLFNEPFFQIWLKKRQDHHYS